MKSFLRFCWTYITAFTVFYLVLAGVIAVITGLVSFAFWTMPSVSHVFATVPFAARVLVVITSIITLVWIFDRDGGRSEW